MEADSKFSKTFLQRSQTKLHSFMKVENKDKNTDIKEEDRDA